MEDESSIIDSMWVGFDERVLRDAGYSYRTMHDGVPAVAATAAAQAARGFDELHAAAVSCLEEFQGDIVLVVLDVCPAEDVRLLELVQVRHPLRPPDAWKIALFTSNSMRGFHMADGTFDQYSGFISEKMIGL